MKNCLTILALTVCLSAGAEETGYNRALQKACDFMGDRNLIGNSATTGSICSDKPFYLFNASDGNGFVIVAGKEGEERIIGYSDKGQASLESMPSTMRWLLNHYESRQSDNYLNGTENDSKERHSVAPLIKTQWGQSAPYNNLCPIIDGKPCLTGCVATAIAQLMNYYKYPASSKAIYAYRTTTSKLQMAGLPEKEFNWAEMLDSYDETASAESCEAVATLMLYSGCALMMDYNLDGSGADMTPVCDALPFYFGYDSKADKIYRKDYDANDWSDIIYGDIANGFPVLYSGRDNSNEGHAFLCDGYDNGFFHVNWGWNGSFDGYFQLSILFPFTESYDNTHHDEGYSSEQMAVISIMPQDFQGFDTSVNNMELICSEHIIYSPSGIMQSTNNYITPSSGIFIFNRRKYLRR